MRSRKKSSPVYALAATLVSALFLGACGQTGALYMPKTHSTTPPPPPRESRPEKKTQEALQEESAKGTEKTDKGN